MSANKHVVCPSCGAVNRIPADKLEAGPACGKCRKALFNGQVLKLDSDNFKQHTTRNDIPVVVDFWAPWCGPCKMMAPAYERAASDLSPHVRLAKLNTEDEQAIAARLNIRSIPTLVVFKNGREVARQAGAMQAEDIKRWVQNYI